MRETYTVSTSSRFTDQPTSLPVSKQQALTTKGNAPTQMATGERAKMLKPL